MEPAEVQLVSLAFKTPADCARMLDAMRSQLASYIAWNEYERIASRNEILSPLSGGGDNVIYRDSPPKYRRQFEKRTQSKLILLYNQVSGINLLNGYQPKL
ncbi:MAG: hypothetical protein GY696_22900 [Gammaproteobacteria bacterium]|nr:hypothetical protein [Gammaproteobacteria bacterium]